jgi:hypothetical protein
MPEYRIYTITRGGRIAEAPAEVDCADDEAAVKQAEQLLDGDTIEVWQRDRRVAPLLPDPAN